MLQIGLLPLFAMLASTLTGFAMNGVILHGMMCSMSVTVSAFPLAWIVRAKCSGN